MLVKIEQSKQRIEELAKLVSDLELSIDTQRLSADIEALEKQMNAVDFWTSNAKTEDILIELKNKKSKYNSFMELKKAFIDFKTLVDFAVEADDKDIEDELLSELEQLYVKYEKQKIECLLSGEHDSANAILSIHPGAGGTEAQDWAEMLYRMYCRYAERRGFKMKVLDYLDGDEAGIKSVSVAIEGQNAYGYLKSESGVHRLVRISPFDSSGRRHTSFASVEVVPEFVDNDKIEINDEDLRIDTHRASGAGGQHVNKTDSAIRILHIPTGIVVGCQTERSQTQNRETAIKMLKSKLLELKEREKMERMQDIKGKKMNIEWGSQIRSYVFMPYTQVKDMRTGHETGSIASVMDGNIDEFQNEYLKMLSRYK